MTEQQVRDENEMADRIARNILGNVCPGFGTGGVPTKVAAKVMGMDRRISGLPVHGRRDHAGGVSDAVSDHVGYAVSLAHQPVGGILVPCPGACSIPACVITGLQQPAGVCEEICGSRSLRRKGKKMSIMEANEIPVKELEVLHEEIGYRYLINDGRILWVYEE